MEGEEKHMLYNSTRSNTTEVSSAQAITQGISKEGGLFVPEQLPALSADILASLTDKTYVERAKYILSLFLTDFDEAEIAYCAENAYTTETVSYTHLTLPTILRV